MKRDAAYFRELFRHIAEEVNVEKILINGILVYETPPMTAREKWQVENFHKIYPENHSQPKGN